MFTDGSWKDSSAGIRINVAYNSSGIRIVSISFHVYALSAIHVEALAIYHALIWAMDLW